MNNKKTELTIKRIKELKGTDSQEVFAKKINMTQSNVSKLLSGMPPSASTLIAISNAYNVSVDWLLGLTDRKSKNNFPSLGSITYADVLAVFDRLIEMESIDIHEKGKLLSITPKDGILKYFLNARLKVRDLDEDTRKYWYMVTAELFSKYKIIKWREEDEELFGAFIPEKPEPSDFIKYLQLVSGKQY